nr:cell wall protein RBR3-like isoform X2 [Nomia melanderi]
MDSTISRFRLLATLIILGLVVLPSGKALKCYVCSFPPNEGCKNPSSELLLDGPPTTDPPSSSVNPSTETSSSQNPSSESSSTQNPSTGSSSSQNPSTGSSSSQNPSSESSSTQNPSTGSSSSQNPSSESSSTQNPSTGSSSSVNPPSGSSSSVNPSSESSSSVNPSSAAVFQNGNGMPRERRSVINRFFRGEVYDDKELACWKITGNETVIRSYGPLDFKCPEHLECTSCTTDGCNSATSTVLYTSMILSMVAILLTTK